MAREQITVQQAGDGSEVTFEAAETDGNSFLNDGNTLMLFVNDSADTAVEVTVVTTATVAGRDVDDLVFNVAFGETWMVGNLPPATYNQASGDDEGQVHVDYDAVADLTVAVIEP